MNSKAPVVILILLCLGLLVGLVVRHNKATNEAEAAEAKINALTEQLNKAEVRQGALESTNTTLQVDRDTTRANLQQTAQQLTQTKEVLDRTQAVAEAAAKALKEKETELAKREGRITELEGQNTSLDKQAGEMKVALTSLEGQIAETEKQLETAEGDRDLLLEELHRLQGEKAEMQRRLNDVVALKEQVVKLRDQLSFARQLENIRRSLYGAEPVKGGELLQRGMRPSERTGGPDLNVEIRREGSATILTVPTNEPPAEP